MQGYPPQQGGYPPQQGGYPPQQGGYPPQQGGYPPQQGGYPPQQGGYPPQQGGYQGWQPGAAPAFQGYQAPPSLYDWFQSVDTDKSGRINNRELQQCLRKGGFTISLPSCDKIINMFDKDGSKQIGYDEFQKLHVFVQGMTTGFKKRDVSGDGKLDGREVRSALRDSGYELEEGCFQELMRKFDEKRVGALTFEDYIDMSIFVGNVRRTFAFYDRQQTGQVTFNFNNFMTAAVTLK